MVIGVHTPEFSVREELDNMRQAVNEMRVDVPDRDGQRLQDLARRSQQLLAGGLLDRCRGRIRHHRFGEGEYEGTESVIQLLLAEAGLATTGRGWYRSSARPRGGGRLGQPAVAGELPGIRRTMDFSSPGGLMPDEPRAYAAPAKLRLNQWALSGDWTAGEEAVVLNKAGGRIVYRFHARDVNLVMGPVTRGSPGAVPGDHRWSAAGCGTREDVDADGARHADGAADVPADPAGGFDRGPEVRDRVPRSGRAGVRVHVRLILGQRSDSASSRSDMSCAERRRILGRIACRDAGRVLAEEAHDHARGIEHGICAPSDRTSSRSERELRHRDRLRQLLERLILRFGAVPDPHQVDAVATQRLELPVRPPEVVPSERGDEVRELVPEPVHDLAQVFTLLVGVRRRERERRAAQDPALRPGADRTVRHRSHPALPRARRRSLPPSRRTG